MTTIVSAASSEPNASMSFSDQMSELGFGMKSLFESLCESTDDAFQRVSVKKKDQDGNFRTFSVTDPVTGEAKPTDTLDYIEHIQSGDMHLPEPMYIVATKCFALALGTPLFTLCRIAWYVCKTPIEIGAIVLHTLMKAGEELVLGNMYEGSLAMRRGLAPIPDIVGESLLDIVKAPLFGLGIELAVIAGIFKPYHFRRIAGRLERALNKGAAFKVVEPSPTRNKGKSCLEACVSEIQTAPAIYNFPCFQCRGNTNQQRIVVTNRNSLPSYFSDVGTMQVK